jgi:WD40 repeat protein
MVTGNTVFTYHGQISWVDAVMRSPNRVRIASASDDGTVQVRDALIGEHKQTCSVPTSNLQALAWPLDSTKIAAGYNWIQVIHTPFLP